MTSRNTEILFNTIYRIDGHRIHLTVFTGTKWIYFLILVGAPRRHHARRQDFMFVTFNANYEGSWVLVVPAVANRFGHVHIWHEPGEVILPAYCFGQGI